VNVYESRDIKYTLTRHIPVTDMKSPVSLVSCDTHHCLYISEWSQPFVVHRINVENSYCSKWSVSDKPSGLSVTRNTNNVLVTLRHAKRIEEYTTDGQLVRQVTLDESIDYVCHTVQLSTGQFVVSHGYSSQQHRVCLVNESGRVVKSYGGERESSVGQLSYPYSLSVDSRDNILVADCYNHRLVLLSSDLTHLRALTDLTPVSQSRDTDNRYKLDSPSRLHLDVQNARLFVGDYKGRVSVLSV